jgi:hypothetical protein
MMEAASTSETSGNFYQTTGSNKPEDSHLHTCSRENLKSQWNREIKDGTRMGRRYKNLVGKPEGEYHLEGLSVHRRKSARIIFEEVEWRVVHVFNNGVGSI